MNESHTVSKPLNKMAATKVPIVISVSKTRPLAADPSIILNRARTLYMRWPTNRTRENRAKLYLPSTFDNRYKRWKLSPPSFAITTTNIVLHQSHMLDMSTHAFALHIM